MNTVVTGDLAAWPDLILCGPKDEAIEADLRQRGHRVTYADIPEDIGMTAARALAEVMFSADALICLPGWEEDSDALDTVELLDGLDIPILDWEDWSSPGDGWVWTLVTPFQRDPLD